MSNEFKNPFSRIRAEQMSGSAWKYYVEPLKGAIGARPLIFEGSRGTGKTMFLKCNSWKEKYQEANANGASFRDFLERNKHIGFYYKADSRFVKSLTNKNITNEIWIGIFNTYFNIIITKEILAFINKLIEENITAIEEVKQPINNVSKRLKQHEVVSLDKLDELLDNTLIEIEHFSNNTNEKQPVGLNAGTIIDDVLKHLKGLSLLNDHTFHIFIDEFENLSVQQQIELNTLLKQSNSDVVYDFGVITKGMHSYNTVMGQEIRPKDDFTLYSTDRYGYYESEEYNELLSQICVKRLKEELDKTDKVYDSQFLNIAFYLKNYGRDVEEESFNSAPGLNKIKEKLLTEIRRHSQVYRYSETAEAEIYDILTRDGAIQTRMHLALLLRKQKSAIPALELVEHKIKATEQYSDWLHNMRSAIVYMLCNELKVEKKYHGFKVYSALSSGVIRSFLELTEYAFDYAMNNMRNQFTFDDPRSFTIDEQTKAVYFVSKLKLNEIDSYEPCGFKLKSFTIALGKIFYTIQTNSLATLGEVEQNHFETKTTDLKQVSPEANELLKYAVRYKILEEDIATKTKSDEVIEFIDYHLNHIYCPAFRISHLRKRKIPIPPGDLAKLFCGTHRELEEVVKKLSNIPDDSIPNLFSQQ